MIKFKFLDELRDSIREKNDSIAYTRASWIEANPYFYGQEINSLKNIIENGKKILHLRCGIGYILNQLNPSIGVGIDDSQRQTEEAKKKYPHLTFVCDDVESLDLEEKFDYILITHLEDIVDIKAVLDSAKKCCHPHTRVVLLHYNYLWNPLVKLAEAAKMKYPQKLHNWITSNDLNNLLILSNYKAVLSKRIILYPFYVPLISYLLNRFIARLPFFRIFTLIHLTVARLKIEKKKEYSVSVIIPCKNEAGNIEDAVKRIPSLGSHTEIIFCDDKSTDGTAEKVREMKKNILIKTLS